MIFKKKEDNQPQDDPFAELNAMVDPLDPEKPDSVLFHFFLYILKGQCNESWKLLTRFSQQKILDTLYEEMVNMDDFYLQNEITKKEDLRKAFEENHPGLKQQFWLEFAINSSADCVVEFGEYRVKAIKNNKTTVDIVFKMKDGMETRIPYQMNYEDNSWRVGIVESFQ